MKPRCKDCGDEIEYRKGGRCPVCKDWNSKHNRQYSITGAIDCSTITQDPWKNLMLAVLVQAVADGDTSYLSEFGQLYAEAIMT